MSVAEAETLREDILDCTLTSWVATRCACITHLS